MKEDVNYLPWLQPGWLETASAWINDQLRNHRAVVNGPIEQPHVRPWSTVLRIPTSAGIFFFKASAPVLSHEPGLTEALYQWRPDCIQTVIAVDRVRAWMLMPDESPALRAIIQSEADLVHWETILSVYAGLQREMIARQADLLALGTLDRRLDGLPKRFERLLEDRTALLIDQPDGLTSDQFHQLTAYVPRYSEMCMQLAASGIPETLHHDDFHDANVFVPGGRYVFSDWGESCVTHPFFSMLVTLRSIAYRFDLAYGAREHNYQFAPQILHLRDVYLKCWLDYGSLNELRDICDLAWNVAMINRALTWHRVTAQLTEEDQIKHGNAVPAWLQEFLDAMAQD